MLAYNDRETVTDGDENCGITKPVGFISVSTSVGENCLCLCNPCACDQEMCDVYCLCQCYPLDITPCLVLPEVFCRVWIVVRGVTILYSTPKVL